MRENPSKQESQVWAEIMGQLKSLNEAKEATDLALTKMNKVHAKFAVQDRFDYKVAQRLVSMYTSTTELLENETRYPVLIMQLRRRFPGPDPSLNHASRGTGSRYFDLFTKPLERRERQRSKRIFCNFTQSASSRPMTDYYTSGCKSLRKSNKTPRSNLNGSWQSLSISSIRERWKLRFEASHYRTWKMMMRNRALKDATSSCRSLSCRSSKSPKRTNFR